MSAATESPRRSSKWRASRRGVTHVPLCDFCTRRAEYRLTLRRYAPDGIDLPTSICRPCLLAGVHMRSDHGVTLTPVWQGKLKQYVRDWRGQAAMLHLRDDHDHGMCQVIEECARQVEEAVEAETEK